MKTLKASDLMWQYAGVSNIDIVEIDGEAFACNNNHWNGERYNDCWQLNDKLQVVNECSIAEELKEIDKATLPEDALVALEEDGDCYFDGEHTFLLSDGKYYKNYYKVC